jgi:hypothetical protein
MWGAWGSMPLYIVMIEWRRSVIFTYRNQMTAEVSYALEYSEKATGTV